MLGCSCGKVFKCEEEKACAVVRAKLLCVPDVCVSWGPVSLLAMGSKQNAAQRVKSHRWTAHVPPFFYTKGRSCAQAWQAGNCRIKKLFLGRCFPRRYCPVTGCKLSYSWSPRPGVCPTADVLARPPKWLFCVGASLSGLVHMQGIQQRNDLALCASDIIIIVD